MELLFMKHKFYIFAFLAILFAGCTTTKAAVNTEIAIVYTNDVHTYINNIKKVDGNNVAGLRFSKISRMVKDMKASGKEVLLVDAGDEIQGTSYGSIDEGESVINIMNAAGYDIASFGNHEFNYGADHFYRLSKKAKFPYVSCNFHYIGGDGKKKDFASYKIFNVGGKKIAFIGISTPETLTSSSPVNFQNEKGEFLYSVDGSIRPEDLYDAVQKTIDMVKDKVDYCIALGHLGVSLGEVKDKTSSLDVIANTRGLDAFIGGHSHTVIERDFVSDADGRKVLSTQTGSYLSFAGIMTIDVNGNFKTEFIQDYERADEKVEKLENNLVSRVESEYGKQIAVFGSKLSVSAPDNDRQRLIRAQEMNIGDFTADSVYWYFNESKKLQCDAVVVNGGGIRTSINDGIVTVNDLKNVQPFGNMICIISATGQQIMDALEMGVTVTGEWDAEWNSPAENGGFLHVAGLRYKIDSTYPSSVKKDGNGMFVSVDGKYRVKNVEIYNKKTGSYEPLEVNRNYRLAGINYILRNSGNGLSMFRECPIVVDYAGLDYEVMVEYCKSFRKEGAYPVIRTKNGKLASYKGYMVDYENPYGSGRISIIKK